MEYCLKFATLCPKGVRRLWERFGNSDMAP